MSSKSAGISYFNIKKSGGNITEKSASIATAYSNAAEKIINNDGTESFVPNQNIFLAALATIVVLAAILLIFAKVKRGERKI